MQVHENANPASISKGSTSSETDSQILQFFGQFYNKAFSSLFMEDDDPTEEEDLAQAKIECLQARASDDKDCTTIQGTCATVYYSEMCDDQKYAYVTYLILAAICFITTVVLAYITVKVIKKVGSADIVIPIMLCMLQLSAISQGKYFIDQVYMFNKPNLVYPEINVCYRSISISASTLFLALAVILNINKWVYFTLRIQANINIREYEIAEMVADEKEEQEQQQKNQMGDQADNSSLIQHTSSDPWQSQEKTNSFHLAVSDIHEIEIRKLRNRKYMMHIVMGLAAFAIFFCYMFYYVKACKENTYYTIQNGYNWDQYLNDIETPLSKLIWITFLILAIILFIAGSIMLNRLRLYFKDFYQEFGCSLWMANICLTLPLTFRAFFDAMRYDTKWADFWNISGDGTPSQYKLATYNEVLFIFATYIPILFQISSLVFGFVRHKKVKLFKSFNDKDQNNRQSLYTSDDDGQRSYLDNNDQSEYSLNTDNKSDNSDNSFFDPPIENYRFYYQGVQNKIKALKESSRSSNQQSQVGLVLKRNRFGGDTNNDLDLGTSHSQSQSPFNKSELGTQKDFYGSIASKDIDYHNGSQNEIDSYTENNEKSFGRPEKRYTSQRAKKEKKQSQFYQNGSFKIEKPKTQFDEYEQRGGVLEEYENLNSERSDSADDPLLQQMITSQQNLRCLSANLSKSQKKYHETQ